MSLPHTAVSVGRVANVTDIVEIVEMPSITIIARSSDVVGPPSASEKKKLKPTIGIGDDCGIVRHACHLRRSCRKALRHSQDDSQHQRCNWQNRERLPGFPPRHSY